MRSIVFGRTCQSSLRRIAAQLDTRAPLNSQSSNEVSETMSVDLFLTTEEVSKRYRREVSPGTLRNWRAMKIGPSFLKIGKAVLYPLTELVYIGAAFSLAGLAGFEQLA